MTKGRWGQFPHNWAELQFMGCSSRQHIYLWVFYSCYLFYLLVSPPLSARGCLGWVALLARKCHLVCMKEETKESVKRQADTPQMIAMLINFSTELKIMKLKHVSPNILKSRKSKWHTLKHTSNCELNRQECWIWLYLLIIQIYLYYQKYFMFFPSTVFFTCLLTW